MFLKQEQKVSYRYSLPSSSLKRSLTQRFIGFIEYPMTLCQNETVQFELFGWVIEAKWGVSSTFGIWASILGIEGSWTSKFEGPQCPLCPQCPLHSAHSGPSNLEVQQPSMPKIESQIPKVELTPHLASITQPNS